MDKQQELEQHRANFAAHWSAVFAIKVRDWTGKALVMQTQRAYMGSPWLRALRNSEGLRTFVQR
jgi:hypothetical protein